MFFSVGYKYNIRGPPGPPALYIIKKEKKDSFRWRCSQAGPLAEVKIHQRVLVRQLSDVSTYVKPNTSLPAAKQDVTLILSKLL